MIYSTLLFVLTAIAGIVGRHLPYLWLRHGKPMWLLLPAPFSLALFLRLHLTAASRTFAAYGCVFVTVALRYAWSGWRSSCSRRADNGR